MKTDPRILIIDNYDSFTYNLVQAIEEIIGHVPDVVRNDQIDFDSLDRYDKLILSPGPGVPDEAGDLKKVIQHCQSSHAILGVCLGQQAIGEVFGASLRNLDRVFHGIATEMTITGAKETLFNNLESPFTAGRYHSWVIDKQTIPDTLQCICTDGDGEIMAIKHKTHPIYAVQFHPESILTPNGPQMLANFINLI